MKFKILKGSATFEKFEELKKKIDFVTKCAMDLCDKLGAEKYFLEGAYAFGGIRAFYFDEKPNGWIRIGKPWQKAFFPSAKMKAERTLIQDLPVIRFRELNAILNFEGNQIASAQGGLTLVNCPGVEFYADYVFVDVPDGLKYTPPDDVIEITYSEYLKLKTPTPLV